MDKYVIAPPEGSTNNSVGASDRPWQEGHFGSVKLNGGDLGGYLAESTGYGIVSGCEPSISGLTVTVGAGVVHLADGTRKELSATNITLDAADSTNPRIDLVYITSAGVVAKVTGTAAASPVVPALPSGGISVCNVSVAAGDTTGIITFKLDTITKQSNIITTLDRFSKVRTIVSGIENAYIEAMAYNTRTRKLILSFWQYVDAKNILAIYDINTQAIETTYTLNISHPIGAISYNETDNVIYANEPDVPNFYSINADDMSVFATIDNVPSNTTYIVHDNTTGYDLAIKHNSSPLICRVYTNGFASLVNTVEIEQPDSNRSIMYQDIGAYNGKIYGANFYYLCEIDVFTGETTRVPNHSWNEIEGIEFINDSLFLAIHQGTGETTESDIDYLYKYLTDTIPQEYDKIAQTNIQSIKHGTDLNTLVADGEYAVTKDSGQTLNYPSSTETSGILTVKNQSKFDSLHTHVTFQKYQSTSAPYLEYTRTRQSRTWTDWTYNIKSKSTVGGPTINAGGSGRFYEACITNYTKGTTPSANRTLYGLLYIDSNDAKLGTFLETFYSAGNTVLACRLYDVKGNTNSYGELRIEQLTDGNFRAETNCDFAPITNNSYTLGTSSLRWKEVFANTATINTSDERLKTDIENVSDKVLDAWGELNWCQFKFKDAVSQKGDNARIHNGLIAQKIKKVFEEYGLDVTRYGLFCYDEWASEPEERDSDGTLDKVAILAGNQYSLRYEEALAMEAAYQRRRADRLEKRIAELEARVRAIEERV